MFENYLTIESPLTLNKESVLTDYQLACLSRQCSLLVRKEVFAGRAKFGIYGDGKELAQVAADFLPTCKFQRDEHDIGTFAKNTNLTSLKT